jgi:hypothetical protein
VNRFTLMIHNAKDLSVDQKAAIESLLGRHVLENEAISVRAIEPQAISDERRTEVLSGLRSILSRWMQSGNPLPPRKRTPLSMRRCAPPVRITNRSGESSSPR